MTIPFTRLLCVDTETTGLEPGQIIQVCFRHWDSHGRECPPPFTARYMPTVPVEARAAQVNGYDPNLWENIYGAKPLTKDDLCHWSEYLADATILGSNPGFDMKFIRAEYERLGMKCPKFSHRMVDTASVAVPLWIMGKIQDTGLDQLRAYCGLEQPAQHDAASDVDDTIVVFEHLLEELTK